MVSNKSVSTVTFTAPPALIRIIGRLQLSTIEVRLLTIVAVTLNKAFSNSVVCSSFYKTTTPCFAANKASSPLINLLDAMCYRF